MILIQDADIYSNAVRNIQLFSSSSSSSLSIQFNSIWFNLNVSHLICTLTHSRTYVCSNCSVVLNINTHVHTHFARIKWSQTEFKRIIMITTDDFTRTNREKKIHHNNCNAMVCVSDKWQNYFTQFSVVCLFWLDLRWQKFEFVSILSFTFNEQNTNWTNEAPQ